MNAAGYKPQSDGKRTFLQHWRCC
uniref:Uncharacterized protein n=1 Tax=Arundo donax TaxID=35708 RepID=A0A0A8YJX9_ARUDO